MVHHMSVYWHLNYLDVPAGCMGMTNGTLEVTDMVLLATCRLVLTIQMHLLGMFMLILTTNCCQVDLPRLKPAILYCP